MGRLIAAALLGALWGAVIVLDQWARAEVAEYRAERAEWVRVYPCDSFDCWE